MKYMIEKYGLIPHPEGGFFSEVYRSKQVVSSPVSGQDRNAVTHIYFLLTSGQVSKFHKVLHDEIWNFYEGAPLRLVQFDGRGIGEEVIGTGCDSYVSVVPGGLYQAAESTGEYSLVGCTVAPGFDFSDFSFLDDAPEALEVLMKKYPEYHKFR